MTPARAGGRTSTPCSIAIGGITSGPRRHRSSAKAERHLTYRVSLPSRRESEETARFLASPVVFLLSVFVAIVDPTGAMLTWLLPINGALNPRLVETVEDGADGTGA